MRLGHNLDLGRILSLQDITHAVVLAKMARPSCCVVWTPIKTKVIFFTRCGGATKSPRHFSPSVNLKNHKCEPLPKKYDLITANKKRTPQGFALLVNASLRIFYNSIYPLKKGDIYTDDGIKIGTHDGLMYYTIGQRGGIGIGGVANRPEEPWFVLHKDLTNNRLIVGQGHDHAMLQSDELTAYKLDWGIAPPVQIFWQARF